MKTESQLLLERIRNKEITPEEGLRLMSAQAQVKSRGTGAQLEAPRRVEQAAGAELAGQVPSSQPVAAPTVPIAVVGMSGRFPGAPNLERFWENLLAGRIDVGEVPPNRWRADDFYDPDPQTPGKSNSKWGGFLEQIDQFDPLFFSLSPREAELMDPQQRLFLTECWRALESAGYGSGRLDKLACGVFAGCGPGDYLQNLLDHGLAPDAPLFLGNSNPILAARISFLLNLRGPSLAVDTACSSSLVAVVLACESLASGSCELALAGGVSVFTTPFTFLMAGKAGMLSPTGRCHTFDARADGFAPSEGVGVLVLKRLADAERDGDPIFGVILGHGTNQDGRSNGITAPSASSQSALIQAVHKKFGIAAERISLVEAHGTGTKLGDPIEVTALTEAFASSKRKSCLLGSVKANIGHASTAAGIAGLIKALLCLNHKMQVPLAGFESLNPHIDLANSPFELLEEARAWAEPETGGRLAAVSSFGFSGTNAHLVVGEAPASSRVRGGTGPLPNLGAQLIVLSARDEASLERRADELADWLTAQAPSQSQSETQLALRDLANSLLLGRSHFRKRAALAASSRAELLARLRARKGWGPSAADELARTELGERGRACLARLATPGSAANAEELELLAACYRRELELDWRPIFLRARFLTLPGYPLQERRCWIPVDLQREPLRERVWGHPLLERLALAESTGEGLVLEKWLHPDEPLLEDHRLGGKKQFPALAFAEMALAGGRALAPQARWRMEDLTWPATLVVGDESRLLRLILSRASEGFAFRFECEGVLLCKGELKRTEPGDASRYDLAELLAECPERDEGEALRAFFRGQGRDYGPAYHGLSWVRRGADRLVARLDLPPIAHPGQGLFWSHPAMAEAALQAALWLQIKRNPAAQALFQPRALEEADFPGPTPNRGYVCARILGGRLELALLDEEGRLTLHLRGLTLGLPNQQLARPIQPSQPSQPSIPTLPSPRASQGHSKSWPSLPGFLAAFSRLEALATQQLWCALAPRIPSEPFAFEQFPDLLQVSEKYQRTVGTLLEMLVDGSWLSVRSDAFFMRTGKPDPSPDQLLEERRQIVAQAPEIHPFARLIADCCAQLPQILSGKQEVTRVLFPTGSADDVAGIYSGNPLADLFNQTMADWASARIKELLATQNRPLRILELGAGTGATTAFALEALAPYAAHISYLFTDLSPAFVRQAAQRFRNRFTQFRAFDLERDPLEQGLEPGFDLILASNVVHATRDISHSLARIRRLLQPGGEFLLNEITSRTAFGSLTFGLTDGWWCFEDGYRRIPGAPLLAPEDWEEALSAAGFSHTRSFGKEISQGQAIDHRIFQSRRQPTENETPEVTAPQAMVPTAPRFEPAQAKNQDQAYVCRVLAEILKVAEHELQPERYLEEYGVDSLVTQQIAAAFERDLGKLPATLVFENPTPAALAKYFREHHATALEARHAQNKKHLFRDEGSQSSDASSQASSFSLPSSSFSLHTPPLSPKTTALEIAIIAASARFPLANDLDAFWKNLSSGRDCITRVPADRWDWREHEDLDPEVAGKTYSSMGGFLEGHDRFDHRFFRISPREAEGMDPQERLFLETAWHTVEQAGYDPMRLGETGRVGVFVGVMNSNYAQLAAESWQSGTRVRAKTAYWSIANRVSFCLDYRGPSLAVDTACSSSLAAIHLACQSLRNGECELALAGGVNLILHPSHLVCLADMHMLSPSGRCRAFGEGADGFTDGEGVGAVLLKPLAQALADRDPILGVIQGSAMNCGGHTNGYTVPNPEAQARVVLDAMQQAGIHPAALGYVEAHGTGTALGDPIEAAGLNRALAEAMKRADDGEATGESPRPALGSVKGNIGHLESAAGIAGLSKILLQLRHGRLAPSLHSARLNPKLELGSFWIPQEETPWPRPRLQGPDGVRELPRCAGLSSFGAGGSNVHLVVEEASPEPPRQRLKGPHLFPFSARTPERLTELLRAQLRFLSEPGRLSDPYFSQNQAFTLQVGRSALESRIAFLAEDGTELAALIEAELAGRGDDSRCFRRKGEAESLLKGRAGEAFLAAALAEREWEQLARLWTAGARIDWQRLWPPGSANRVALPGYPFEPIRHWLGKPEGDRLAMQAESGRRTDGARRLDEPRLLGELDAGASLGAGLAFGLNLPADAPILAEHRVKGQPVLPGVASLILAKQAWEKVRPGAWCRLHALSWRKQFRLEQAASARFRLVPTGKKPGAELSFELGDGQELFSSGLFAEAGEPTATEALERVRARFGNLRESGVYEGLRSIGIEHGPYYQVLKREASLENEGLAELVCEDEGNEGWSPAMLDGLLQSIGTVGNLRLEPMLPVGVGRAFFLSPPGRRAFAHATRTGEDRFRLVLYGERGEPSLLLEDFEIRRLGEPLEKLFFAPHWKRRTEQPKRAPRPHAAVIVHDAETRTAAKQLEAAIDAEQTLLLDSGGKGDAAGLNILKVSGPMLNDPLQIHYLGSGAPDQALRLFRLLRQLVDLGWQERQLRLSIAAKGIYKVFADDIPDPEAAGLAGLALSASREFPNWRFQVLDLEKLDPEHLLLEGPPIAESALALRNEQAYRRELVPVRIAAQKSSEVRGKSSDFRAHPLSFSLYPLAFQKGCHYLIIGGGGGIGLALAEELVSRYSAHVLLLGRSPLDPERKARLAALDPSGSLLSYRQVDAGDAAALEAVILEAEAENGPLHGIFHGALVLRDRAIRAMDEACFLEAFDAKARTARALEAALLSRRPDFVAFFSSAQSFLGNAGQSNYSAGCTFLDGFALRLAAKVPFPVRLLNWGYWGEVGSVATPAYRNLLAAKGIQPISTRQGLAATEAALASPLVQLVPFKADPRAFQRFGMVSEPEYAARHAHYPALSLAHPSTGPAAADLQALREGMAAMDVLASRWFLKALFETGLARSGEFLAFAGEFPPIAPRHLQLVRAGLEILASAGLVSRESGGVRFGAQAEIREPKGAGVPRAYLELVQVLGPRLAQILTGELPATDLMFPDGSSRLVSGIYKGHALADGLNQEAAAILEGLLQTHPGRLRILEVGGGTGGTTSALLPLLANQAERVRYDFTDLSRTFVRDARRRWEADYPFMNFEVLDISEPPSMSGEYDLLIAANVLHATPDLRRTLNHAATLLRANGLLLLNEVTALSPFTTFTFGLLDGWWNEADGLRMANGPLLSPSGWRSLLCEEGFFAVETRGYPGLGQHLIAARAGSLVRLPHAVRRISVQPDLPKGPITAPAPLAAQAPAHAPAPAPEIEAANGLRRLETMIVAAMAKTLEVDPSELNPDTPHQEFGLDSILGVEVISQLNRAGGWELSPTDVFNYPTIRQLAKHIQERFGSKTPEAPSQNPLPSAPPERDKTRPTPTHERSLAEPVPEPSRGPSQPASNGQALQLQSLLERYQRGELSLQELEQLLEDTP